MCSQSPQSPSTSQEVMQIECVCCTMQCGNTDPKVTGKGFCEEPHRKLWAVHACLNNSCNVLSHKCPTHLSHECPTPTSYYVLTSHFMYAWKFSHNENRCASRCWCSPTRHTTAGLIPWPLLLLWKEFGNEIWTYLVILRGSIQLAETSEIFQVVRWVEHFQEKVETFLLVARQHLAGGKCPSLFYPYRRH